MTRTLTIIVIAWLYCAVLPVTADAQARGGEAGQTPAPPAQQTQPSAATPPARSSAELSPGFEYRAEGRRDPFVSLLGRGSDPTAPPPGARPPGLAGMLSNEINLTGIMVSRGGYVAVVRGIDKQDYLLRAGEKLLDGVVKAITATEIVIVQPVNDPLSLQKTREVRKALRQPEGAK